MANNLPARSRTLLPQEATVMTECEFCEGYGYIFFMKAQYKKRRMNVVWVRKDVTDRNDFRLEHAEDHYIQASIHTTRGRLAIINMYLPPQGSIHYDKEVIENLGFVGADAVCAGDWIGTGSMQAMLQEGHEYNAENNEGNR